MVTLALAVVVLGTATTASARPKKHIQKHVQSAERTATTTTNCYGTPIIMQGMDCPRRAARGEEQELPPPRAERTRITRRGSSGAYNPALLTPPSLPLSQPSAGVYIPPPVANPSAQINQLNQSFPLNGGLGLIPLTATPISATTSPGNGKPPSSASAYGTNVTSEDVFSPAAFRLVKRRES
jgi:hypothetical protein